MVSKPTFRQSRQDILSIETFEERSVLAKYKEGDNKDLGFWFLVTGSWLKEKNQKQQTRDRKPNLYSNRAKWGVMQRFRILFDDYMDVIVKGSDKKVSDTIFMIHGMWGGAWYWEKFRSVFEAKGYRCVAVTLPYHDMGPGGIPDPRLETTGLLDYAESLEREIGKLGTKPIVMGHSMGGLLAQILGARALAKSLVLLTTASPSGIMALYTLSDKKLLERPNNLGFLAETDAPDIQRGRLLYVAPAAGKRTERNLRQVCL